jgi:hypothetical protein
MPARYDEKKYYEFKGTSETDEYIGYTIHYNTTNHTKKIVSKMELLKRPEIRDIFFNGPKILATDYENFIKTLLKMKIVTATFNRPPSPDLPEYIEADIVNHFDDN